MTPIEVRDNQHGRFEAMVDGEVAGFAEYRRTPGKVTFTHTVVNPRFEGQGIGGQLAKNVLDAAVEADLKIIPQCDFIAGYIKKHPDYIEHVDEPFRVRVQ
ncbi:MAG: N-acetyltransferase [Jatrophihabitantaceae bacterium]|nr:N-acetyltransferase [Jatrophihabitantaceae bacterium]